MSRGSRCIVCNNSRHSAKLRCRDCPLQIHPRCLDYSAALGAAVRALGNWQCPDCKTCVVCSKRGREASLLLCDSCDRGLHMECAQPPLKRIPTGAFHCDECCRSGAGAVHTLAVMGTSPSAPRSRTAPAPPAPSALRPVDTPQPSSIHSSGPLRRSASKRKTLPDGGCHANDLDEHENSEESEVSEANEERETDEEDEKSETGKVVHVEGYADTEGGRGGGGGRARASRSPRDNDDGRSAKRLRTVPPVVMNSASRYRPTPEDELLFAVAAAAAHDAPSVPQAHAVTSVSCLQIGRYDVSTWCHAPYPEEYLQSPVLFVCEFCFDYNKDKESLQRHVRLCRLRHPPGKEIYRKDNLSVFEVNGAHETVYCQNLCLLAKLFLEHKTLYYDVEPFYFYILTEWDEFGAQFVGYFSKEKVSDNAYNVSCIMCLPQHQGRGFGKLLIDLSYALSRREGKTGTPERPLSDLGLVAYRAYWRAAILEHARAVPEGGELSIRSITQATGIQPYDIVSTMQALGALKYWRGNHMFVAPKPAPTKPKKAKRGAAIAKAVWDERCLRWTPARDDS